jgi:two-component system OmpR family sensor kinase
MLDVTERQHALPSAPESGDAYVAEGLEEEDRSAEQDRSAEPDAVRCLQAEVVRLRGALRESAAEADSLREAVAARDAFIATAGHELRNAMGGVLVAATHLHSQAYQISQTEPLPAFLVPRLEQIARLSRTFVRRATTLLDVSRLTTTGLRLSPVLVSWAEIWDAVHAEVGMQAERAGCELRVEVDPRVSGFWDRDAVEQMVVNLVSNAIKFGAKKPVIVSGGVEDGDVTLRVRDRGIGISEADRARIFARFERAVRSGDLPGFGLGLWIARQLARAHGGEIHVESEPGHGSVFTIRLPGVLEPPHR